MNNRSGVRKSIFYTEKNQNSPELPPQSSNSNRLEPTPLILIEGNQSFTNDPNSQSDVSPIPSPRSKSLSVSRIVNNDPKNSQEHANILANSGLSKSDVKMNSDKSPKATHLQNRLPPIIRSRTPENNRPNHPKNNSGFKRPPNLNIKKPFQTIPESKLPERFVTVQEDDKENSKDSHNQTTEIENPLFAGSSYETISENSDYEEEEHEMDPHRQAIRKKLRKAFYASYFVGIAISLQNRVRLYGTLKAVQTPNRNENEIDTKKKSIFPLMPSNNFRVTWTILLVIMIIITTFLTPFDVSFINDDDYAFQIINRVFDAAFGLDMIINFLSAFYDPVNGLVTDFRTIAITYLKAWFWIDLVAILPFDTIIAAIASGETGSSGTRINKLLRLLRFPRLYRLFKILRLFKMLKLFSTSQGFNKILKRLNLNLGLIKMVKFFFNIFLLNHFVGCLWFFIARVSNFEPDTWVAKHNLIDADAWTQYIASYYWALQTLTTVGFGDFAPGTAVERIIAILWMIVGVGVYSFTIGNLSSLLANMDRRATILKKKLSAFNNFCSKVKLPEYLRLKVQRFFELNHKENVYYWIDPADMIKHLPENLKSTLLLYSYHSMIKNIELLELNANFTASILTHLKLIKLEKREILYREEDPSEEIYFISKGSIKMVTEHGHGIYTLVRGTYFGELELLEDTKRLCFAQASESSIVIVCDKAIFLENLKEFPEIEAKIRKVAKYRREKMDHKVDEMQNEEGGSPVVAGSAKMPRKPLLKSTDYFYQVLLKTGKKKAIPDLPDAFGRRKGLMVWASKGGNSASISHLDAVESFRKLYDVTGSLESQASKSMEIKKIAEVKVASTGVLKKNSDMKSKFSNKGKSLVFGDEPPASAPNSLFDRNNTSVNSKSKPSLFREGLLDFKKSDLIQIPEQVGTRSELFDQTNPNSAETKSRIGTLHDKESSLLEGHDKTAVGISEPIVDCTTQPTNTQVKDTNSMESVSTEPSRPKSAHIPSKWAQFNKFDDKSEGDFMDDIERAADDPRTKLEMLKNSTNKASYLNWIKEGMEEVRKLQEQTDYLYSEMDSRKEGVINNFGSIAERQKEINMNVEKLFGVSN